MSITARNPDVTEDWVQPLQRENLSDRAYLSLRDALMRGQLRPGERLRLRPVAARFGISPTPMREALLRLVVERALTLDARGTVMVPSLTLEQLLEIRAIRVALEGNAAAAAAAHASEAEIAALEEIHAGILTAHSREDWGDAIQLNTRFHLELCRMGGLPVTFEIVESLWVRCGPILSHLYDAGVPDDWDPHPHLRVIHALRQHDPESAREAMKVDIEKGGHGLLAHVSRNPPDE